MPCYAFSLKFTFWKKNYSKISFNFFFKPTATFVKHTNNIHRNIISNWFCDHQQIYFVVIIVLNLSGTEDKSAYKSKHTNTHTHSSYTETKETNMWSKQGRENALYFREFCFRREVRKHFFIIFFSLWSKTR